MLCTLHGRKGGSKDLHFYVKLPWPRKQRNLRNRAREPLRINFYNRQPSGTTYALFFSLYVLICRNLPENFACIGQ